MLTILSTAKTFWKIAALSHFGDFRKEFVRGEVQSQLIYRLDMSNVAKTKLCHRHFHGSSQKFPEQLVSQRAKTSPSKNNAYVSQRVNEIFISALPLNMSSYLRTYLCSSKLSSIKSSAVSIENSIENHYFEINMFAYVFKKTTIQWLTIQDHKEKCIQI